MLLNSVDFAAIEEHSLNNNWKGVEKIVVDAAKQLERAGADMIVLCTNLIHKVSEAITSEVSIPFLHIADTLGQAIANEGLNKVLLLGTQPTMEDNFYTSILENRYGLRVVIPNEEDRDTLQKMIYNELLKGIFPEKSKHELIKIIDKSILQGIEGVVMACTELPMLVSQEDLTIPQFDTGAIQAAKAVELAIN
ncbi:MAG: amino acid racemase [Flavobacteriaceae bacterium]|nr:amino acid racemase [Flavobacteriaceae bacterium]